MKNTKIILLAVAAMFVLIVLTLAFFLFIPQFSEEKIVHVRPGDNASQIAAKLSDAGIIRSKTMFIALAKLQRADRHLQTGSYIFGGQANLWQTVKRLREGKSEAITITFPEGLSLYKTCQKIDRSGLMPFDSLFSSATNPSLVKRLTGFELKSLEGFLYPETYRFSIALSADSILAIQTAEFFKRLQEAGIDPQAVPNFYEKLILASIVEKEAGPASERPLIAGVFMNRMARGMKLQSCPTVDYVLEPKGIRRSVLTYKDTQIDSPYNTYRFLGLPPTPIANPSVESILAVLNPKPSSYLYFFSDRKGKNVFSASYSEHLARQKAR